jgi:hypothetical protein
VTSVTKARPRCARKARMSGSLRAKVFSTYSLVAEFQTTAVTLQVAASQNLRCQSGST